MTYEITVSVPGRICLFGEHQDYLGLPVITAAINRRVTISGNRRTDQVFHLQLPDIGQEVTIDARSPVQYQTERDYLRSVVNVLLRENISFPTGYDCTVRGNIPINSGTSSSSALIAAWIGFLLIAANDERSRDPMLIAKLAHRAEVLEFNEPGGMMDHYATCLGNVQFIEFGAETTAKSLPSIPGAFVLGDSQQPKDTKGILSRVKIGALDALAALAEQNPGISIQTLDPATLDEMKSLLTADQYQVLSGNIINRELTREAVSLLGTGMSDARRFGDLLNLHQRELRDRLRISTTKIDRMIDAALAAGAYGAKINGSGGGGCMFAYAPENSEQVAAAIEQVGGKAFVIYVDSGIRIGR